VGFIISLNIIFTIKGVLMSDILGRHTNKCDYCDKKGYCPQCQGKGFIVEGLDKQVKGIRRGDILLISCRFDPVGWIIRIGTKGHFNHCAWVINDKTVIELKAKGKRTTSLKKYLNKYLYKCKLVRPILDKDKLNEAIKWAEKTQFDYPYTSALINFILIKLKITKDLPRLSCSGFIAYYLAEEAKFFFNGIKTYFITPADIEFSTKCRDVSEELY